jgi:RND superfamily putative drug exporter
MSPVTNPSALRRLGRWCYRHHWRVLGAWIVAIVVLNGISGVVGDGYSQSFGNFDSEATSGFELLEDGFGPTSGENQGMIVFTAEQGVDDPEVRSAMTELFDAVDAMDDEGDVVVQSPYEGIGQIAAQGDLAGKLAFAVVDLPGDMEGRAVGDFPDRIRAEIPELDGVEVLLGGQNFAAFEEPSSEMLGIGFAIVILILAFGSVLAMGLPIGMALAGIGAGLALVTVASNFTEMPQFTSLVAIMLGLGVGIDYALFIVTRFREDLHKGMDPEDCAGHAIDTAGRSVIFAGVTVVISVLGMLVMGLGFIKGLGIGTAIAVVMVMLASLTLLPALLGLAGDRIEVTRRRGVIAAGLVAAALVGGGLGFETFFLLIPVAVLVVVVGLFLPALKVPLPPRKVRSTKETGWYRYSRFVQHHSWFGVAFGLGLLVLLAIPVLGIRLGFADEGQFPEGTDTRQAYDLLVDGFGPGFNGPLLFVAAVPEGTDEDVLDEVTAALNGTEGLVGAFGPTLSDDGSVARWVGIAETSPQSAETERLVRSLRGDILDDATAGTGVDVLVTSFTAISIDFSDYLAGRYVAFFATVLGLSFLLLMAVFRSILVPLKAVLVNLLSIGAAYGVVVAIFQWGWGSDLFGLPSGGPVEPFLPMMLFAIVFGLSMDYEVFLLSRMKEEYDRTGDNAEAVADGLAVTARVITAAALIMVTVFGSFLLENDRTVKLFGTGLAVAVFLDATIVRMLLVPSTMELLGDRNWWLPKWLDRILPVIHVEGGPEDLGTDDDEVDGVGDDEGERRLVGV